MAEYTDIAIIGGGLMGAGIAQVFARAGMPVKVCEPDNSSRDSIHQRIAANLRGIGDDDTCLERISVTGDMESAVSQAACVIEAAPEKVELKRSIFSQLVALAPREAILASNTSVIPIARIAQGLPTADRIIGTHWWNPPYLVPLVEVIQSAYTADATVTATMDLLHRVGKVPAHIRKDVPGFVANRLQHALWREAISMVAEGICDAKTLDDCVKNSFGLRLPVLGPLENADLVGLDLTLDIHRTIIPELNRDSGPSAFLKALVDKGDLGFKSGKGFRAWSEADMQHVRERLANYLVKARQRPN